MDHEDEVDLGIGLVRNEEYIGLYFNLTAWNIYKPKNVIQLSLRRGSRMISILIISDEITLSIKSCWKKFDPLLSKRNEEGNVQAGTHLIIIDDSPCHETIDKSNPIILNYYRQFLIKGFDRQDFSKSRFWNSDYQLFQVILPNIISQCTAKMSD